MHLLRGRPKSPDLFPPLNPELLRFICTKPQAPMYHYTSLASLLGILKSRQVWASHIASLNDDKEYQYALELVYKSCRRLLSAGSMPWNSRLRYFVDNFQRLARPNVFVFSLSEKPDLLSQWRSYVSDGDGVSVGFSPLSLLNLAGNNAATLVKCVYEPATQEELIEASVGLCVKGASGDATDSELESSFLNLSNVLSFVAPTLKHPSFVEEQEWRVVRVADRTSDICFRARANEVVPYLGLTLGDENDDLPLESLTIGPTRNPDLAFTATTSMLKELRIECRNVAFSPTPYRP